jgi:hypothetical protein
MVATTVIVLALSLSAPSPLFAAADSLEHQSAHLANGSDGHLKEGSSIHGGPPCVQASHSG